MDAPFACSVCEGCWVKLICLCVCCRWAAHAAGHRSKDCRIFGTGPWFHSFISRFVCFPISWFPVLTRPCRHLLRAVLQHASWCQRSGHLQGRRADKERPVCTPRAAGAADAMRPHTPAVRQRTWAQFLPKQSTWWPMPHEAGQAVPAVPGPTTDRWETWRFCREGSGAWWCQGHPP